MISLVILIVLIDVFQFGRASQISAQNASTPSPSTSILTCPDPGVTTTFYVQPVVYSAYLDRSTIIDPFLNSRFLTISNAPTDIVLSSLLTITITGHQHSSPSDISSSAVESSTSYKSLKSSAALKDDSDLDGKPSSGPPKHTNQQKGSSSPSLSVSQDGVGANVSTGRSSSSSESSISPDIGGEGTSSSSRSSVGSGVDSGPMFMSSALSIPSSHASSLVQITSSRTYANGISPLSDTGTPTSRPTSSMTVNTEGSSTISTVSTCTNLLCGSVGANFPRVGISAGVGMSSSNSLVGVRVSAGLGIASSIDQEDSSTNGVVTTTVVSVGATVGQSVTSIETNSVSASSAPVSIGVSANFGGTSSGIQVSGGIGDTSTTIVGVSVSAGRASSTSITASSASFISIVLIGISDNIGGTSLNAQISGGVAVGSTTLADANVSAGQASLSTFLTSTTASVGVNIDGASSGAQVSGGVGPSKSVVGASISAGQGSVSQSFLMTSDSMPVSTTAPVPSLSSSGSSSPSVAISVSSGLNAGLGGGR